MLPNMFKVKVKNYGKVFNPSGHWKQGEKITVPGKDGEPVELIATNALYLWRDKKNQLIAVLVPSPSIDQLIVNTAEEGIAAVYALMYVVLQDTNISKAEIAIMGIQAIAAMKDIMDQFQDKCLDKKAIDQLKSKTRSWMLMLAEEVTQLCDVNGLGHTHQEKILH